MNTANNQCIDPPAHADLKRYKESHYITTATGVTKSWQQHGNASEHHPQPNTEQRQV